MSTKTDSQTRKTARVHKTNKKKKSLTHSSEIFPKMLWKHANGDLFYKENGKFLPFTGDIEKWLGVEES